MKIIDTISVYDRFATLSCTQQEQLPLLAWKEAWKAFNGKGIVAGLVDTPFDKALPDLIGADVMVRNFSGSEKAVPQLMEHGTYSVATLIGQGHRHIRGIAPCTRLLVAEVVGADGKASLHSVAASLSWLIEYGAGMIILPLGEAAAHPEITEQLQKGASNGILFFAAAGNYYPHPLVFPAQDPLTIAVGAADRQGNLLSSCCRYPRLDIVAPGWNIPAPVSSSMVRRRAGSSVACVLAAGAAILALSIGINRKQASDRTGIIEYLKSPDVTRPPPA
jgi:subtilisin family serine protease